jgi:hypothetical protein
MPNTTTQIEAGFSGGMMVPPQPGQDGGFKLIAGDDYLFQLISILASDCDSDNPFLTIGLGLGAVFQNLSETGWRAQQTRKIQDVFQDLQRAQIAKFLSIDFGPGTEPGEMVATVRYLSIETGRERELTTNLRRS